LGIAFIVIALCAIGAKGAEEDAQLHMLRTENNLLKSAMESKNKEVQALKKEVESLKTELERMKRALDQAGIDVSAMVVVKPPVDQPESKDAKSAQDANASVAEAIQKYAAAVSALKRGEFTDIQKRERWLSATKQVDAVLRRSYVTITYTLDEVTADASSNTVLLSIASAIIKSSDPAVGDLVFESFYQIRIQATEKEAQKFTKTSAVTMRGNLALNIDLSKPASEQPELFGDWDIPGYRPVGKARGMPSLGYDTPTIMIKEGSVLRVDGIPRKMPEAGYRARFRITIPPKP
jgi:hypothetical protein